MRAVPIVVGRVRGIGDEIPAPGRDPALQVRVGRTDTGIDDADDDTRVVGIDGPFLNVPGGRHLRQAHAPLLREVGVVGNRGDVDRPVGLGITQGGIRSQRGQRLGQMAGRIGADDESAGEQQRPMDREPVPHRERRHGRPRPEADDHLIGADRRGRRVPGTVDARADAGIPIQPERGADPAAIGAVGPRARKLRRRLPGSGRTAAGGRGGSRKKGEG